MGPEAEPYRPSWLPFGRARLAASSRETSTGTTGAMGTPVRRRIPMAPVQVSRAANRSSALVPAGAASPVPTTPASPMPAPPRQQPRTMQQAPVRAAAPPAAPARTYTETSTPNRATQAPSRTSYVPGSRTPAPALPVGVSTTVRMPQQGPLGRGAGRRGSARRPGTPPFDGLAIAAIFLAFIVAPFALVLAIASVRRAYTKGISPVLSWLAVLLAGFGTLVTTGLWTVIADALQGIGG